MNASVRIVTLLSLTVLGCAGAAVGPTEPGDASPSAKRAPTESFGTALTRHRPRAGFGILSTDPTAVNLSTDPTAVNLRAPYAQVDFSGVVAWDPTQLTPGFQLVRDTRAIPSQTHPELQRRPAFLYPDDGCFVRAEYMGYECAGAGYPRPSKIFAFGNLSVATANAPSGSVTWWYHVAPVVQVGGQPYVLDPSIEPTQPLTVSDWLSRMDTFDDVQVTVCDPYAYVPNSPCAAAAPTDATAAAMGLQDTYLDDEWQRQLDLGRDPTQVLADSPPSWTVGQ
jgi:hypothetical protein